jgi:hypothetical protein
MPQNAPERVEEIISGAFRVRFIRFATNLVAIYVKRISK